MSKKVFISYRHTHREWVFDNLAPCLWAGGAEVLIDRNYFEAGKEVKGQGDALQDRADVNLLVFSKDYFESDYCLHEMKRAIARDPDFAAGTTVAVRREDCDVPDEFKSVLYLDLFGGSYAGQWDKLLAACGADLGTDAEHWLARRNEALQFLQRGQSVNLVVKDNPRWREMIEHLGAAHLPELRTVDLARGATASRRALVEELLKACGVNQPVPAPPEDLVVLDRALSACPTPSRVALLHGDLIAGRPDYDINLFAALRSLIMDARKLVLLVQSRRPFAQLVPHDHPLSMIDIKMVELNGR